MMNLPDSIPILVIGGGISGAVALQKLRSRNLDAHLIEADREPGGVMKSHEVGGFLVERGPSTIRRAGSDVSQLIDELGLASDVVPAHSDARRRFVLLHGKLVEVPSNPRGLIETDLLSAKGKLRLLGEPFIPAADESDESVADFVKRRLGKEVLERAVDPFVAGIFAGDPERLSARYAFPKLWAMEREHGSLLKGALRNRRQKSPKRSGAGPAVFSFKRGLGMIPQRIAERHSDRFHLGIRCTGVDRAGDGWRVSLSDGDGTREIPVRELIVALPALQTSHVLGELDRALSRALREVEHPPLGVVTLAYRRRDTPTSPSGFGALVPKHEGASVLGCIYVSSIYPDRVPDGYVQLTFFVGGARNHRLADSLEGIGAAARQGARSMLGITASPTLLEPTLWEHAIPQYNVGYGTLLGEIDRVLKEFSGLHLLGNYHQGVSIPERISAACRLVESITAVSSEVQS